MITCTCASDDILIDGLDRPNVVQAVCCTCGRSWRIRIVHKVLETV